MMAVPLAGVAYRFGSGTCALALHTRNNTSHRILVPRAHGAAVLSLSAAAIRLKTFTHWLPRKILLWLGEAPQQVPHLDVAFDNY